MNGPYYIEPYSGDIFDYSGKRVCKVERVEGDPDFGEAKHSGTICRALNLAWYIKELKNEPEQTL